MANINQTPQKIPSCSPLKITRQTFPTSLSTLEDVIDILINIIYRRYGQRGTWIND